MFTFLIRFKRWGVKQTKTIAENDEFDILR